MKSYFGKFRKFLGAFFCLWLLLQGARLFGLHFWIDISLLSRTLFFFILIWVIGEIRANRAKVSPLISQSWLNQRSRFIIQMETIRLGIISFSPKILSSRAGNIIVLPLTFVVLGIKIIRRSVISVGRLIISKKGILFLSILGILVNVFSIDLRSNLLVIPLAGFWIWAAHSWRFKAKVSIISALALIFTCPYFMISGKEQIAQRMAVWVYLFLIIGLIQMCIAFPRFKQQN